MKILHINSYYGYSKFYKSLYDNQVKSGLDISVFVPVFTNYEDNGFDYGTYTTISMNHKKYDRYIFHLKHNKIIRDVQQKYNIKEYSIIHAHSLFSNGYVALKLKKRYNIPYIVAVRDTDVNLFFKKMIHLRKLGVEILKEASQVIFLSKPYKEQVLRKYVPKNIRDTIENKVSIIPNGIDKFWIDNIGFFRNSIDLPYLKLLQVGEISKRKNILTTIKVAEILIKKGYNIELNVVGKIKSQQIFNKIKDLNYVNYLGYKSKEELIDIYCNNDIFVLPSVTETFGLVYAEAMSQGLPVIYTRNQGFDWQFLEGKVGYSVDCYDANEIAERIIRIIKEYQSISKNCIDLSSQFSWNKISSKYYDIYMNINTAI